MAAKRKTRKIASKTGSRKTKSRAIRKVRTPKPRPVRALAGPALINALQREGIYIKSFIDARKGGAPGTCYMKFTVPPPNPKDPWAPENFTCDPPGNCDDDKPCKPSRWKTTETDPETGKTIVWITSGCCPPKGAQPA